MKKASRGSHIRAKLAHRNEMLKLCGRLPCGTLTQAEKAWHSIPPADRKDVVDAFQSK